MSAESGLILHIFKTDSLTAVVAGVREYLAEQWEHIDLPTMRACGSGLALFACLVQNSLKIQLGDRRQAFVTEESRLAVFDLGHDTPAAITPEELVRDDGQLLVQFTLFFAVSRLHPFQFTPWVQG